jgi:hypothetical protein
LKKRGKRGKRGSFTTQDLLDIDYSIFWHFIETYFWLIKRMPTCCLIDINLEEFSDRSRKWFIQKSVLSALTVRVVP